MKRTIKSGSGAHSGIDLVGGLYGFFIFGVFGAFGGYLVFSSFPLRSLLLRVFAFQRF
ncbi:MAG: hypothetical protein V2J19_04285 [Wenzhouxiangella sp.]|nr:hypothetical protein [Wenzhouxiangella sp.]